MWNQPDVSSYEPAKIESDGTVDSTTEQEITEL